MSTTAKNGQNKDEVVAVGDKGDVNSKDPTQTGKDPHNQTTKQWVEENFQNKAPGDQIDSSNKPEEDNERAITNPRQDTRGRHQPLDSKLVNSSIEDENMSIANNFQHDTGGEGGIRK